MLILVTEIKKETLRQATHTHFKVAAYSLKFHWPKKVTERICIPTVGNHPSSRRGKRYYIPVTNITYHNYILSLFSSLDSEVSSLKGKVFPKFRAQK